MRSLAACVFIAAVGAVAIALAMRPTVADGRVIEEALAAGRRAGTTITCDREIPIGVAGAVFECTLSHDDGSRARLEVAMDRTGALSGKVLEATGPTEPRVEGADPWD